MIKATVKNSAEIYEPINLTGNEQQIMNAIKRNPRISKIKISKEYNISVATVKRGIDTLKKRGLLQRVGSNKGGYWKIIIKSRASLQK
ncbi:MAG: winged helix-turn-helix transcriptional regulator [Clostridia bacterium]|nr:winged helix-turn-helix transcriptional regulator [Clostridia bacterium]MDD4047380.1 winged helix-turn-helix transcriptional regulator [Clostridia bacterium]